MGQYYQEARDRDPVQIVLPPGTYVPEFVFQKITPPVVPSAGQAGPISLVLGRKNQQQRSRRFWWSCAVAGVIVAAALALILRPHTSNFDDFWQPVLDAHTAPVLSLPTTDTFQLEPDAMQQFSRLKPGEFVQLGSNNLQSFHNWHTSLPVLKAALSVALALQRKGMSPILRIGTDLSSDELRGHPIVAIGSFSNPWTKQNVAGLRFTFDRSASDKEAPRIRDNRNPGRSWSLPSIYPKPQDKDYAIVTRTFDPITGTPFVSLAGLHSFGNQIAGEFVSQESFWNELAGRAPAGVTGSFAPFKWLLWPPNSLRIVDWNIDRGLQLQGVIDFLGAANADILILQEVDLNARRTHRLNIAEEIARKLEMNYVFGREFEELVQGSNGSPAYHGQATLSKWPISKPRLIRFSKQSQFWQPHWFLPRIEPFQERLGGRIALVAQINVAGTKVVTYNLHLESRGSDALRISQLGEVLSDATCDDAECPVIVAGDLNLDASREPVALALANARFQDAVASSRSTPTTPAHGLFEGRRRIDWAFVRGPLRVSSGHVHGSVKASDHYPISFMLTR